jgi:diketogulonate reductase-like aldo/keto reductase
MTKPSNGTALAAGTDPASESPARTVKFRDGTVAPALGQGSWHLGEGRRPPAAEEEALRTGVALGMTPIDTAEI